MEIEFFRPQGPQPTEMAGIEDARRGLPRAWKGFANFVMRQPNRRGQDRELDLVIVVPDRIILVDLKIRDNAKILASLIRSELPQLPAVPPIESIVVLTHPLADPSGLDAVERDRTIKLADFKMI